MDGNNWRAAQPQAQPQDGDPNATAAAAAAAPASGAMETGDWRTELQPESRQRIVNKIMETLERHLPFSGLEGLQELKKIAVKFEEKSYNAAISQSDYLRKISIKMISMETKSQNPMANPLQANVANSSQNPQGTGPHPMQPQVINQVQQLSVPMVTNQSQAQQQLLSQNIQNNWRVAQPLAQPQGVDPNAVAAAAPASGAMETGDWRTQLQPESRQRIVNKIMETLERHLHFSGPEGLQELEKIAVKFEEKFYTAAISQSDYLRKISIKMLSMETKSQNPMANPLQANVANSSQNPQGTGPHPMQPLVNNQVQQLSVPMVTNQSQTQQQLLSRNIQNNWRAAQPLSQPQGVDPNAIAAAAAPASGDLETGDWRTQLQLESRQRIVNKIMETLKKHLPFSGPKGLQELEKIAVKFEEKIYTAAISQSDYLRKISLKMLSMETKSQNPMASAG